MAKVITIYFSMKGETIAPMMKIVNLDKGNTAVASEYIQEAVGGDLFEIEPDKTYLEDHMKMIYEAQEELKQGTRVPVKRYLDNFEDYDIVFFGYPNWWNSLPMPVVTFAEHYDWSGKRIVPFCTNEGSGIGNTVSELKEYCKGAKVDEGTSFKGHSVRKSKDKIQKWAKQQLG